MDITFTKFTSPEPLSKRYWLEDGTIQKQAAAQMTKGTAERVTMPFAKFAEALETATDKQSFGYGITAFNFPDRVKIATKGKAQPEKKYYLSHSRLF